MATLSLDDILNADSFSFGSDSLSQIDPANIKSNIDINLAGLSVTSASILDDLFASSAKSDGSCRPKQISYQPLAEATAFTSGTNQSTSALGAIVNNSNAFLDTSKDYIDKSASLNPDLGEAANFSKERVIDANRILSTGAMALSNSSEKANGGIVFSAATDFKLAGNNVYLGSESIMHTASPIIVSNAKVGQYQENFRSLTFDAEHKIGQSSFKQVDFSHRIHSFDHKLTAQSDRSFSKDMERTATNINRTAGDQTQLYANSHMEAASANTYRGTARGTMVHQAGDISIAASSSTAVTSKSGGAQGQTSLGTPSFVPPSGCITIAASGDELSNIDKTKGNITLVSTSNMTQASSEMVEMSNKLGSFVKEAARILAKDVMHQAWGSFTGLARGKNQVYVGNHTTGLVAKKGKVQINPKIRVEWKMPNPLEIDIPEIINIPPLPELPTGLEEQDLASCIPERYRQSNAPGRTPPTFPAGTTPSGSNQPPSSKPSYEPSHQRNKPNFDPYCKSDCIVPTNNGTTSTGTSGSTTTSGNLGNPVVVDKSKLPPNTSTSSDSPNTTQDRVSSALNIVVGKPVASVKGGLDIYINRPEDTAVVFNPIDPSTAIDDPLAQYSDVFIDNKEIDDLIISLQNSADELTRDILAINAKRLSTPETTLTELQNNIPTIKLLSSKLDKDTIYNLASYSNIDSLDATPIEKEKIRAILRLPGAPDLVCASLKELNITLGIGFLGSVLSFTGDTSLGISEEVTVISNDDDTSSGNLSLGMGGAIAGISLANLGVVAGSLVAGKKLGLSDFINAFNPALTGTGDIGKSLLNGTTGTKFVDDFKTSIKTSINTAVTQALYKVVGVAPAQVTENMSAVLCEIKVGIPVSKADISNQFQSILEVSGINIPTAAPELYNELSDVINGLSSGNIAEVLTGGSLRKLLSSIVGSSNIAILDQVSSAIGSGQDLFKSLSKIPALLSMMNDYDIPLLDQISSILSCVDIIQQVEELFHSVEDIFDDEGGTKTDPQLEDILQLFENLPRLIQTLNAVQATKEETLMDVPNLDTPIG